MKLDKTGMTKRKKNEEKDLMVSNKSECKKKKNLLIINWKMWNFCQDIAKFRLNILGCSL